VEKNMKKHIITLMALFVLCGIIEAQNQPGTGKIIVVYFSVPETDGVDAVAGASRVVVNRNVLGNTQFIAQTIQTATGGDLFRIETVQPYPGSHNPLLAYAMDEKRKNERPRLTRTFNAAPYDVIFLGFPNWNADLPMPLYAFLENTDLSGKTIVPFSTHGGSGFSNTIRTIAALQPRARVIIDGFTVSRTRVANAAGDVTAWVRKLGMAK
jgi:flavodoxin